MHIKEELLHKLPESKREALIGVLRDDPRPSYQGDRRSYGMAFAGFEVTFFVKDNKEVVVTAIDKK